MQKARSQAFPSPEGSGHSPPTACKHTVSGTISLPSPGFFSPFPHGTSSLSVTSEYLALEDGPPSFPRNFTCSVVLGNCFQKGQSHFAYGTITLYGCSFQKPSAMTWFVTFRVSPKTAPQPRRNLFQRFGLFPFRSPLLGESLLISVPGGTEMFHFPPFASHAYGFSMG